MEEQTKAKRPIALPVTLIILVFSLMGNVLFITKNIGHTQAKAVADGEAIYNAFVEAGEYTGYMLQYVDQVETLAVTPGKEEAARLTAAHMAEAAVQGGHPLDELMRRAEELDGERFQGALSSAERFRSDYLRGQLGRIGEAEGELTQEEIDQLQAVKEKLETLSARLGEFHYAMGGNKSAMIRLAGGFEWIDLGERLMLSL